MASLRLAKSKAESESSFERWYANRRRSSERGWWLLGLPMLLFLTVPLGVLILRTSPTRLIAHLQSPAVTEAIGVSLKTTLISTSLILLLGTPLAYTLGRRQIRYRRLVDTIIDLPIVLPPAVAGLALLMTFGRRGLLGGVLEEAGLSIAFSQAAVVMAQVFVAAPFFIKSAILGFAGVDPEMEQAAALDGANGWQLFRYVSLPLSWADLLSGGMMSWARALGEFGATIIFAGNFLGRTQTMPLAIYIGFEVDPEIALALSVILLLFSALVLLITRLVASQSATRLEG